MEISACFRFSESGFGAMRILSWTVGYLGVGEMDACAVCHCPSRVP